MKCIRTWRHHLGRWLVVLTSLALLVPSGITSQPLAAATLSAVRAAPVAELVLTPIADSYVDQLAPTTNFGTGDVLAFGRQALLAATVQRIALLQFDLEALPAGAIITRAELRLSQTAASGAQAAATIHQIDGLWSEDTVTWASLPASTPLLIGQPLPAPGGDPAIAWDVTELVRQWAYGTAFNRGLALTADNDTFFSRELASRETRTPPQLWIEYSPPPVNLIIPTDTVDVQLDGRCQATEYERALAVEYVDVGGQLTTARLKHDTDHIYLCVEAPRGRFSLRFFGLYLDTDNGREKYATEDDYSLQVNIATGITTTLQGTGDPLAVYTTTNSALWNAVVDLENSDADRAEYVIDRRLFASPCTSPFGLAFYHRTVRDQGDDYGLPVAPVFDYPVEWLQATLENPGCIRVCSETATPCGAAAGALVQNAATGETYPVNSDGYVLNSAQIDEGTPLWAMLPVSTTGRSTLYHTSGQPQTVSASAFAGPTVGTMTLVVTAQRPLLVQDLALSAQWFVQGDPARAEWLQTALTATSDFLYSFTDGQFALGKVTVRQNYDGWDTADIKLHLNNLFQPRADIGGIVLTDTVDLDPSIPLTYSPGSIYMGSYWNRYGTPPGQPVFVEGTPVSTDTLELDWSVALAHELGHYLLYLFDVYTDIDGNASQVLAEQCSRSAMGNAYVPGNHAFIYDQAHWDANCSETEAYLRLGGRTEWETINLWYPWSITPSSFITGPILPEGITSVTFITPTVPAGPPAASQIFALNYVDDETNSAEARAFILRNNRVLEQGKPAVGSNQVQLIDAQLGDRLCLYDINDHSEGSDTPRHQFGCEIITAGDATLDMTKNVTWAPEVELRQTGPDQLTVVVTQPLTITSGLALMASLYPEHGELLTTLDLTNEGRVHTGVFTIPEGVPPLYLQLAVNEQPNAPLTRREVIVDRGTGGSGAFGPARGFGKVLIISSDGHASYESDEPLELGPGESIAWQSMPGTPPLPDGLKILGQSYRLDAYPASLVAGGRVSIRYQEATDALQAANADGAAASSPAIYFWDGQSWQPLETTITTPLHAADGEHLASASSQGVGVYAVVIDQNQTQLYLPLIGN
jgi:hypothetical protein